MRKALQSAQSGHGTVTTPDSWAGARSGRWSTASTKDESRGGGGDGDGKGEVASLKSSV